MHYLAKVRLSGLRKMGIKSYQKFKEYRKIEMWIEPKKRKNRIADFSWAIKLNKEKDHSLEKLLHIN